MPSWRRGSAHGSVLMGNDVTGVADRRRDTRSNLFVWRNDGRLPKVGRRVMRFERALMCNGTVVMHTCRAKWCDRGSGQVARNFRPMVVEVLGRGSWLWFRPVVFGYLGCSVAQASGLWWFLVEVGGWPEASGFWLLGCVVVKANGPGGSWLRSVGGRRPEVFGLWLLVCGTLGVGSLG